MPFDNNIDAQYGLSALQTDFLDDDLKAIVKPLWKLYQTTAKKYLSIDSGSMPYDVAKELFCSVCYIVKEGLSLYKKAPTSLSEKDVLALFSLGTKSIGRKLAYAKKLYGALCLRPQKVQSAFYCDTVKELGEFFNRYDYIYFAHDIKCSIDYPLLNPIDEKLLGASYICEYLKALYAESVLQNAFDENSIRALLKSVYGDYRNLPINLCEQCIQNALLKCLLNSDINNLTITQKERENALAVFRNEDEKAAQSRLNHAAQALLSILIIKGDFVESYAKEFAQSLSVRIKCAATGQTLGNLFTSESIFDEKSNKKTAEKNIYEHFTKK